MISVGAQNKLKMQQCTKNHCSLAGDHNEI